MLRELLDSIKAAKSSLLGAQVVQVDVDRLHLLTPARRVNIVLQLDCTHSLGYQRMVHKRLVHLVSREEHRAQSQSVQICILDNSTPEVRPILVDIHHPLIQLAFLPLASLHSLLFVKANKLLPMRLRAFLILPRERGDSAQEALDLVLLGLLKILRSEQRRSHCCITRLSKL